MSLSTQKLNPNPDALERQPTRQRRRSVGKRVGALAVAAAISLAAVVLILATRAGETTTTSAQEPPTVASRIASGPFLINLRTGERTPLPEDLVGGYDYRASPDGRRVAYGTCCDAADSITVANLEGAEFHQFTPRRAPTPTGPSGRPTAPSSSTRSGTGRSKTASETCSSGMSSVTGGPSSPISSYPMRGGGSCRRASVPTAGR
jgi:hypothetical protein